MTTLTHTRPGRAWSALATLIVLAAAPAPSATAIGSPPTPTPADGAVKPAVEAKKVEAGIVGDKAKAIRAVQALRELQSAVEAADEAESRSTKPKGGNLPGRPSRAVVVPTIDPAAIDALLSKALAGSKTPTAPMTTDEEFVRRVTLDVTGRPPTIEQTLAFVANKDKAKRAKLIDHLLGSDAYATNWARYWRDVIAYRAPNENVRQVNFPAFEAWMVEQLRANRPWDEVVTAILTAEGPTDENGAVAFGIAQSGQAVELAGEVSRVFMGVQIQCAQCHDHPNDPWKREQFHEFAAFFAGLRSKISAKYEKGKGVPRIFELAGQPGVPRYTMPDLKDPAKLIPINPKFFLADASSTPLVGLKGADRRALAASYVTGQDNPWFAKAFVNRVWGSLMGEGFVNPVDDLGPTKEVQNPEVLEAIASQWQSGGYDVRWLLRTILNTRAYQRESRATNTAAGRTAFAANCAVRLRADQIFDSLAVALDLPVDSLRAGGRNPARLQKLVEAGVAKSVPGQPKAVQVGIAQAYIAQNGPRTKFNQTFGVDPSTPGEDVLGTIPQALFLMNSPIINAGIKAGNNTVLGELLKSTPDNRAVLDVLYLRVLARRPTSKEVTVCGRYVEGVGNRAEAFEDILWGLINSAEFISRR